MPELHNLRSLGFVVAMPVIGAGFLVFTRTLNRPDPSATLTGKLERLVGDWTANKVPVNSRVVNLIVGDAAAGGDALSLPEAPAAPTFMGKLKGLFGRGARAVNTPNPFTDAFAQDKRAVSWTFDGFSKAEEKAVVEELAKNIVALHDAKAELNIVARGEMGAAVLKAVQSLEGQVRDGAAVGANSLVILGMDSKRLKAYDPAFFATAKRPANLGQWANVYGPGMRVEDSTVELYSAKYDGKELPGKFLMGILPPEERLSSSGLPIRLDALALGIIGAFDKEGGLEQWMTQQEWQEEQRLAQEKREAELAEGKREEEEEARRKAGEEAKRREEVEARCRASEEAAGRAAQWVAQGKTVSKWPIKGRTVSITWVSIPGGSFMMGSMERRQEKPVHHVAVRGFQMAKTEVTNAQYRACVLAGACTPPADGCGEKYYGDDQPVVYVDWSQANAFSKWVGGRLPAEAEWEYAARSAGKDWAYPWGQEKATCVKAVIDEGGQGCGRVSTWPVCSKPNGNTAQGLCDMVGNVWEWPQDWYHDSYYGAPADGSAWESPEGAGRVIRGGSWCLDANYARSTFRHFGNSRGRYFGDPRVTEEDIGFRPAR